MSRCRSQVFDFSNGEVFHIGTRFLVLGVDAAEGVVFLFDRFHECISAKVRAVRVQACACVSGTLVFCAPLTVGVLFSLCCGA